MTVDASSAPQENAQAKSGGEPDLEGQKSAKNAQSPFASVFAMVKSLSGDEIARQKAFYRLVFGSYVGWFLVHRLADVLYLASADAKFPAGLEHLYESEE